MRTLREGDILWRDKFPSNDPWLLVQRIHHKVERHGKMIYWYDGVFLSLMTGKLETKKLSNAMTYCTVERAPRPPEPVDEDDDDDDSEDEF